LYTSKALRALYVSSIAFLSDTFWERKKALVSGTVFESRLGKALSS